MSAHPAPVPEGTGEKEPDAPCSPVPSGTGAGGVGLRRPAVSVVMAAKNYARFLPEAIGSVRAQTFTDWELLVVDDGSTDDTPGAIRPLLADRRVRYVRSDALGQVRAKNLGVGLSRAALVAFLDADDAWEPTKLEKQLAVFDRHPDVGVVFSRRALMDEAGRPIAVKAPIEPYRGRVLPHLFTQNFVCFSSAVVRRHVLSQVGRFDAQWDLAIDYDLWLRVATFHRFEFVDEVLVRYRTGHGNLSKRLRDRVDIAMSIMSRAEARYGVAQSVPAEVLADGYASTCQTLGFVLRGSEPLESVRWYLRALRWPARRVVSLKGVVAGALAAVRGPRAAGAPENAHANL